MTVNELIKQLMQLQQQDVEVAVYEGEADDFITIGKIEIADNGNQVRLHSQYAVDADLC
jgi:hypothetical protein